MQDLSEGLAMPVKRARTATSKALAARKTMMAVVARGKTPVATVQKASAAKKSVR